MDGSEGSGPRGNRRKVTKVAERPYGNEEGVPSGSPDGPTNGTACAVLERGPRRGGGRERVGGGGGFP